MDKQSNSSRTPQALVTSLKQYTVIIADEYLQKFDDTYHFYDSALHIHQESFRIGLPSTMFQAIQEASHAQNLSLVPSTKSKRRKALGDITEVANKVRRTERAEANSNKERMGSLRCQL
jgi:hypothetical protein